MLVSRLLQLMAGGIPLLPNPLFDSSGSPALQAQPQPQYSNNIEICPLLSIPEGLSQQTSLLQVPQTLTNAHIYSTLPQSQSLDYQQIPPLLPTPTTVPGLMQQTISPINLQSTLSQVQPLMHSQPRPLMSQTQSQVRPLMSHPQSQLPAYTQAHVPPLLPQPHSGPHPPPLMPQGQFVPYRPPHRRPGFNPEPRIHDAPLMSGHLPYHPYPSQQRYRGGRGRGRHFRGRGSGAWRSPQSTRDGAHSIGAYYNESMFVDPWAELLIQAGVEGSGKKEQAVRHITDGDTDSKLDQSGCFPTLKLDKGVNDFMEVASGTAQATCTTLETQLVHDKLT